MRRNLTPTHHRESLGAASPTEIAPPDEPPDSGIQSGQFRLGAALSILTVAQVVSGFGIQWYTIAHLGVGIEADALYAGATFPQIAIVLLMEPLSFVLIPFLSSKTGAAQDGVAWPLFCIVGTASVVVAAVFFLLAPLIVHVLVPGLVGPSVRLTVQLTQIQVLGLISTGCGTVLSCISQAKGRFVYPAVSLLLCTCGGWLLLVLGLDKWGVRLAAWTQVTIATSSALLLLPLLGRVRRVPWDDMLALYYDVWRRMRPLVVSALYSRTGFVVDRFLASLLSPGSIAILDIVLRIHSAIGRVLNHGVVAPIVPRMARLTSQQAWGEFNSLWRQRAQWMGIVSGMALLTLVMGAFVAYQWNVLDYVSGPGRLEQTDLMKMWGALIACSGVVLAGGINHIFVNAFYAQDDMVVPARIEACTYTIGLIMKGFGVWLGGLVGIAAAISAYYLLNSIVLGVVLTRRAEGELQNKTGIRKGGSVPEVLP